MIALALSCQPRLLIADEPTTALDVTVQAQVLRLLRGLQRQTGTGLIFITHHERRVVTSACAAVRSFAGATAITRYFPSPPSKSARPLAAPWRLMLKIRTATANGTLERDHAVAERWARRPFRRAA
jgi:ABC-type taurine transport system ATPase subunit